MHGIKETKEFCRFIIELAEAIDRSMADGKVGFDDVSNLVSAMMSATDAFSGITLIPNEIKDMDETEAAELIDYVKQELDLSSERAEEITEKALDAGLKIYQLITALKSQPTTPAA